MAFTKIENGALSDNVVVDDDKITSLSASKLTGALPAIDGSALTGISIPTVPTNLSEFTNDSGYITGYTVTETDVTTHQSALSITESQISDLQSYLTAVPAGYATETYVNTAVSNLVDAAPTTLDTLNELAAALGDDPNFATTTATALGNKADTSSLATVATSGSYSDLSGTPALNANATAAIGLWTWGLDGNDLVFRYNGTDVFKITTAGAMIAADNVIAYGTP